MIYLADTQGSNLSQIEDILALNNFNVAKRAFTENCVNLVFPDDVVLFDLDAREAAAFSLLNKFINSKSSPGLVVIGNRSDFPDGNKLEIERGAVFLRPYDTKELIRQVNALTNSDV